jgi:hypothetical protein
MPVGFAAVLRIDDLRWSRYPHRAVSCGCPATDRARSAHRARCNSRNRSAGPPARGERGRAQPFSTVGWRSLAPRRTRVRRQRPRTRGVPGARSSWRSLNHAAGAHRGDDGMAEGETPPGVAAPAGSADTQAFFWRTRRAASHAIVCTAQLATGTLAGKRMKFEFRPQLHHDNYDVAQRLSYSSWRRHQ